VKLHARHTSLGHRRPRHVAMANPRQNYAPANGGYKGHNMLNAYGGQAHGSTQYLSRGQPMSPHGDGMHGLTNNMAALNMHASYGSTSTSKSAASGMSGNSSEYGNVQQLQGQGGLWVPNQHVIGSMYQMMPAGQQQPGMAPSPNMYNQAGAYLPQASYQYGQAVDHSPMPPGWAGRIASGEMPSLMTLRQRWYVSLWCWHCHHGSFTERRLHQQRHSLAVFTGSSVSADGAHGEAAGHALSATPSSGFGAPRASHPAGHSSSQLTT
jgi:hypothetical protein